MNFREEKVLLSANRLGRVAIVARKDGRFCLYQHWRWPVEIQRAAGVEPAQDVRWTLSYDAALYDNVDPLPGIYGTVEDAKKEARTLLDLNDG